MVNQKPCKFCGGTNHPSFRCFSAPKKLLRPGKAAKKWLTTRKKWFEANKQFNYSCYYCGRFITQNETTLDHFHPRGSNPHLRYDLTNLVPCCYECNGKKGSVDGVVYLERIGKPPRVPEDRV